MSFLGSRVLGSRGRTSQSTFSPYDRKKNLEAVEKKNKEIAEEIKKNDEERTKIIDELNKLKEANTVCILPNIDNNSDKYNVNDNHLTVEYKLRRDYAKEIYLLLTIEGKEKENLKEQIDCRINQILFNVFQQIKYLNLIY